MDQARYSRLHELFEQARALPPEARAACLAAAQPEDAAEVEALLAAETSTHAADALSEAAIEAQRARLARVADAAEAGAAPLPSHLGPYRIVQRLGVGGMGVVYAAEQSSPRRTVALKVVHPGFRGRSREARFRREAELLGRLHHPGIAQIYEAGEHDLGHGVQPYFAMELVEGHALVAYAVLHKLSVRQRLELFAKVADAIEHAHQQGVLHRDLKPDNVLVDRRGQPKVLDFGVARPLDAMDSLALTVTGEGELVGTLTYMSPEQCSGTPESIGPHSDVYALGVMLYELLTGRTPLRTAGLTLTQAIAVLTREDPPRPSAFDPHLAGDIETLLLTALERDPRRRYASAAAFADDIRRYLEDRPLLARPPSAFYRGVKFVRRHRSLVAFVAVLLVGLAGTVGFAALTAKRSEALRAANDRLAHALYTSETRQVSLVATQPGSGAQLRRYVSAWRDAQVPPGTRGFEFHLLERLARPAELRAAVGTRAIRAQLAADGTRLALATVDGPTVLDAETLAPLAHCDVARGYVFDVAFDPAGRRLAFTTHFDGLFVWDIESDAVLWSDRDCDRGAKGVEWHPSGAAVVSTTFGGTLRAHDADTGALLARLPDANVGDAPTLAIDDRGRVVVVSGPGAVHRYAWPLGSSPPEVIARREGDEIDAVGPRPGSDEVAFALRSGRVVVAASGDSATRVSAAIHSARISSVSWDRAGSALVTASNDFSAAVLDAGSLLPTGRLVGEGAQLDWAHFSRSGDSVLTGGTEPWVERWSLAACDAVRRGWVLPYRRNVGYMRTRLEPSGERVATLSQGRLTLWTPDSPPRLTLPSGEDGSARHFDWSPDADAFALVRGQRLTIESVDPSQAMAAWAFEEELRALAFGPRGSDRLYFHTSHELWTVAPRSGSAPVRRFDVQDSTRTLLATRDGSGVIVGGIALGLVRLGASTFELEAQRLELHSATCVAESPDGGSLVVGLLDHGAHVVGARDLAPRFALTGHTAALVGVAWSPDGSRIATAGADGMLLLWDAADGDLVAQLDHGEPLADVVFAAGGAALIAQSESGALRVWTSR